MSQPLLQFFFDEKEPRPLTVSELNAEVKAQVERRFIDVWVEGEITNFKAHGSGHWYFSLHDGSSQLRAVCFRSTNYRIRFKPADGLLVRIRGRLSVYEQRGEFQLITDSLQPVGDGALSVAFEQIKAKLEREGLFAEELKRPLPAFPRRIGVVTSPSGAAFFDILHVLSRRARSVSVVLIPTRVQGETAGGEIRRAIKLANELNQSLAVADRLDALIVGRGGGSSEDLWAFNEEGVARAIRDSLIPVISAVGHEIDHTIADLVADLRAATPSAAAEIVAAREADVHGFIDSQELILARLAERKVLQLRSDLQTLAWSPVFAEFPGKVRDWTYDLDEKLRELISAMTVTLERRSAMLDKTVSGLSPIKLSDRVARNRTELALLEQRRSSALKNIAETKAGQLGNLAARLNSLSPLAVLDRGYSITTKDDGKVIRNADDAAVGDKLKIRLARGKLEAEVLSSES